MTTGFSGQYVDLLKIKIGENANNLDLESFKPSSKKEQNVHYEIKVNGVEVTLNILDKGEKVIIT